MWYELVVSRNGKMECTGWFVFQRDDGARGASKRVAQWLKRHPEVLGDAALWDVHPRSPRAAEDGKIIR